MHYILPSWKEYDMRIRIGVEISLGFILFTTFLLILGSTGMYTLSGVSLLLVIFAILGFPGHRETYSDIQKRSITFENHKLE